MTREQNIKAILETYFAGFKEEIIDSACKRILDIKISEEPFKTSTENMSEQEKWKRGII